MSAVSVNWTDAQAHCICQKINMEIHSKEPNSFLSNHNITALILCLL